MPQMDIILTGSFAISSRICRKQQEKRHPANRNHNLLNSRAEFNRCAIPRLGLKMGEKEYKEKWKELQIEEENEAKIEERIKKLRKNKNKFRNSRKVDKNEPNRKRRKIEDEEIDIEVEAEITLLQEKIDKEKLEQRKRKQSTVEPPIRKEITRKGTGIKNQADIRSFCRGNEETERVVKRRKVEKEDQVQGGTVLTNNTATQNILLRGTGVTNDLICDKDGGENAEVDLLDMKECVRCLFGGTVTMNNAKHSVCKCEHVGTTMPNNCMRYDGSKTVRKPRVLPRWISDLAVSKATQICGNSSDISPTEEICQDCK